VATIFPSEDSTELRAVAPFLFGSHGNLYLFFWANWPLVRFFLLSLFAFMVLWSFWLHFYVSPNPSVPVFFPLLPFFSRVTLAKIPTRTPPPVPVWTLVPQPPTFVNPLLIDRFHKVRVCFLNPWVSSLNLSAPFFVFSSFYVGVAFPVFNVFTALPAPLLPTTRPILIFPSLNVQFKNIVRGFGPFPCPPPGPPFFSSSSLVHPSKPDSRHPTTPHGHLPCHTNRQRPPGRLFPPFPSLFPKQS